MSRGWRHHFSRGVELETKGRSAEAIAEFRRATELDPSKPEAWLNLGMLELKRDRQAAAEAFIGFLRCADDPTFEGLRGLATQVVEEEGLDVPPRSPPRSASPPEPAYPVVQVLVEQQGKSVLYQLTNDSGVPMEALQTLLGEFSSAPTFLHAYVLVAQNAALLSSIADLYLRLLESAQDDEPLRVSAELNRRLLRRAREVGPIAAFAEVMKISERDFRSLARGVTEIEPRLVALANAESADEQRRVLEADPQLAHDPDTAIYLRHLMELQSEPEAREMFRGMLELLEQCRREGLDAAFAESGSPPIALQEAWALLEAAQASGQEAAIQRAIDALEKISDADPQTMATVHNLLAMAEMLRFAGSPRPKHIEAAIAQLRRAIALAERGSGGFEELRGKLNLIGALTQRFEATGDLASLEEAVAIGRALRPDLTEGTETEGVLLNGLGAALLKRGSALQDAGLLDEAVELLQRAHERAGKSNVGRVLNLALALNKRFQLRGQVSDLDRVIHSLEVVARELDPARTDSIQARISLASALRARASAREELGDVDRAIEIYRELLSSVAGHATHERITLNNLNTALRTRFELAGRVPDIDEAIALGRASLALSEIPDADLWEWHQNVARSLMARHGRLRKEKDIEEAIELLERTVSADAASPATRSAAKANLGSAWLGRFHATGRLEHLRAALPRMLESFERHDFESNPVDGLSIARQLGMVLVGLSDWQRASEVLSAGFRALDLLDSAQLSSRGREAWIAEAGDLHALAAMAHARCARLTDAVLALERGRARLLSEAPDITEGDRERLVALGHGPLARRHEDLSSRLRLLQSAERKSNEPDLPELIGLARRDLEEINDAVRRVLGLSSGTETIDYPTIARAAEPAPLVYVCATHAGGLALIIRGREEVRALFLPDLTARALEHEASEFARARDRWTRSKGDAAIRRTWFDAIERVTGWLGDVCMKPICGAAGEADEAVLIPIGLLSMLPLHGAWTEERSGSRWWAIDAICWRYVPGARALVRALADSSPGAGASLLMIVEPLPSASEPLAAAAAEAASVASYFDRKTILRGTDATRRGVLQALPNSQIIHFSGHGFSVPASPSRSGVLLSGDQPLRVEDLFELKLWKARLITISACETALTGARLPDETIGLPAGLLRAGAAGVIASLWSVNDRETALLMAKLYEAWRKEGSTPARALAVAQRWFRDTDRVRRVEVLEPLLAAGDAELEALYQDTLLAEDGEYSRAHPFYWCGFSYTGV